MAGRRPLGLNSTITNNGHGRRTTRSGAAAAATATTTGSASGSQGTARKFHPNLISAQIVAFQCFQYLAQSVLFQMNAVLGWYNTTTSAGSSSSTVVVSLDRLFTDKYIHLWKAQGWVDCWAIFVAAFIGSFLLTIIVEKSKMCLDFSVTYFILHLVISSVYYQVPATADWWIVHVFATIVMVLVGEYLCSLRELSDIPLLQL